MIMLTVDVMQICQLTDFSPCEKIAPKLDRNEISSLIFKRIRICSGSILNLTLPDIEY